MEEYLTIYPERKEKLLFGDRSYTYPLQKGFVLPARKRYVETEKGIRQYNFIEINSQFVPGLLKDKKGKQEDSLLEKRYIIKFAP